MVEHIECDLDSEVLDDLLEYWNNRADEHPDPEYRAKFAVACEVLRRARQ